MISHDTLSKAQTEIAQRITAYPYFVDIPVIDYRQGDILLNIQRALGTVAGKNGKSGVCAIVLQPSATVANDGIQAPTMNLKLVVRVLENVTINTGSNGTRKSAASVARAIVDILHLYYAPGIFGTMHPDDPTIKPYEDTVAPVAYEVNFTAEESPMDSRWQGFKCEMVQINKAGTALPYTITLSSLTVGATILYTLDGSYPATGNSAAHVYSAPFEITTAATLRAVATLSDRIDSNTNLLILS